jgi:thiol-disulfide isomerase/thioredoxin
MRTSTLMALLAAAVLAAAAGLYAYRAMVAEDRTVAAAAELARLHLPDLSGKDQELAQWRNHVLVVNFWATWCEPCRDEVPALLRVQAAYASKSVTIVGIAVDSADKVRQFADEFRIGYPLLIGGLEVVDLTQKLGNTAGGLPYTVVVNKAGKVVVRHLGRISEAQLESAIQLASG